MSDSPAVVLRQAAAPAGTPDSLTLAEIRTELARLVAIADTSERPKPDVINPAGHAMPGHEWQIAQHVYASTVRPPLWVVRTADDSDTPHAVYVAQPDPYVRYEGHEPDFISMLPLDARRLAMALLAAADRAEHLSAGVPRLEDRRDRA